MDVICIMAQVKIKNKQARRLKSAIEIINVSEGKVGAAQVNEPFVWRPTTDKFYFKTDSKIFEKIIHEFGLSPKKLSEEFRRRTLLLMKMYELNITEFNQVQQIINAYYKTPELVLKKFNIP